MVFGSITPPPALLGWEFMESEELNNDSEKTFVNVLDTDTKNYMYALTIQRLTIGTDDSKPSIQIAESGSSWKSGASDYQEVGQVRLSGSGTPLDYNLDAATHVHLVGPTATWGLGNDTGETFSSIIIFPNPRDNIGRCLMQIRSSYVNTAGYLAKYSADEAYNSASGRIRSIRLYDADANNLVAGHVALYRLKGPNK